MAAATTTTATPTGSVTPFALTTTFTAPTQCAQAIGGFTMLEDDAFRIWLNAPVPVPGTTISSCYPSQFMSSFLLQAEGVSQAAFNPLVCPQGYATQSSFSSNYIACCPSGWDGLALATNAPADRPAFGATCFTNIFNVALQITSYDNSSLQASSIFTPTHTADQAFAYPYEGYAFGATLLASPTPTKSSLHSSTGLLISSSTGKLSTSSTFRLLSSSTGISSSSSSDLLLSATSSNPIGSGSLAAVLAATLLAAVFVIVGVLFLRHRRKSLYRHTNFNQYKMEDSFREVSNRSKFAELYGSKEDYDGKFGRKDQVTPYELEERRSVYELDAGPVFPPSTKELPKLPPPHRASVS